MSEISSRKVHTNQTDSKKIIKDLVLSVLIGIGSFLLLSCLCGVAVATFRLPVRILQPVSMITGALAVLISSFVMALCYKKKGLLCGVSVGTALFLLLTAGALLFGVNHITRLSLIRCITFLICGAFGGYAGVSAVPKIHSKY